MLIALSLTPMLSEAGRGNYITIRNELTPGVSFSCPTRINNPTWGCLAEVETMEREPRTFTQRQKKHRSPNET